MPTNIDSLQIEIQSNSTNAAVNIRDLSKALGELKKNSSVNVAIKNLNNLSATLKNFTVASNATTSIGKLSGALAKLKSVGSVGNVGTALNKLTASLKTLQSVDLDKVRPQIQSLVDAVAPLSAVKAGGLNTMLNSLRKLGQVTDDLDDAKITAFKGKIDQLVVALTPLSTKMTTIQAGLQGVNGAIKQTTVSVAQANTKVNVNVFNLSNLINVFNALHGAIQGVVQKIQEFVAAAIEWDGISQRFGRGFGAQAQETYDWIKRLNEEMGINIQQFMQYSSIYANMLQGFGVSAKDANTMALGYTELTYDIWAGYNDIYTSFTEASEAIKSAIAGEVEPIRRAGFTIVETQLEQTAANHGLTISLHDATEAQKFYLRYLTLVDQAHAQNLVGTYAKELNTAEGLMRTFSQQLKSLTQAFGSLFLPILVKVMPYLQAFVELLTEGIHALAALFGITIQGVDFSDYETGIGGVTEGTNDLTDSVNGATDAIKEMKNASIGIDELNVISPPSSSSGGGSGAGGIGGTGFENLDVDSLWDESIFKDINNQVDAIKEKFEGWLPVIKTIAGILGGFGIALLLAQMGEGLEALAKMDGLVAGLKRTLAGLTILTIEAVLVFMLSDEYLETGNLMALLGEALVTATGGYLMYKGFGAKGLMVSLGVSMAMQLAAITLNLADGGVDIDDPELWIQSAFTTALGGVVGGFLSYKGLINMSKGKGIGVGVLAGLSLTLAAITIGEVAANGEATTASIFTGLGSILAAAGFGFMIGGPWGALIGAAVGLAVNVIGATIGAVSKDAEKNLKEDLESRFGTITLDSDSLEVYVDTITAVPRKVAIDSKVWNEKIGDYEVQTVTVPFNAALELVDAEHKTLENLRENLETSLEKLGVLNVKIAVGVDVKSSDYATAIDNFVTNAQNYLDQFYLTSSMSISILDGDNSTGLQNTLADFYMQNSEKLSSLGKQLKETVSTGFVDGEWLPGKREEAIKLQEEIQEIVDYVADVEYRAELQNLKLSVSGDMLTPDSFKDVLNGAKEAIEGKLESLEEVKMSALKVAIMEYDANIKAGKTEEEAKRIYDETVKKIEIEFQNGKLDLSYGTVNFGLETLKSAFAVEIARAESEGWFNYNEKIEILLNDVSLTVDIANEGNGNIYKGLGDIFNNLYQQYSIETDKLSSETRKNLTELLEAMKPTMADYEELAVANRKAGETVTEEIRNGLNDYNKIAALTGDTKAINYMIGQQFSNDPVFLNTLATVKGAGGAIPDEIAEGLLNNIDYVKDEASGLVVGIKDSVTGKTIELTPTLKQNMEDLGVDLSDGLLKGAETEMKSQEKSWKDWAIWPWNWFKEKNEINSPSKLFEKGGGYLTEGLLKGVPENSLKDRISDAWTTAKTWWNEKKGELKKYTPSIGSIKDKVSSAWTSAKTWWNERRSDLKKYTPSIGSIKDKVSSAWTSAKNWWNDKRSLLSYTPSIGSIRDKLKSAWNTAKTWWKDNVKLSIPSLSFKVTYEKATGWKKAIVNALGLDGWPKLSFAANGGIFDTGSLIWAGERGPEIMANAGGGKTGVMNVQQMADAVYEGVYAAVIAANRASAGSGEQAVHVYLDSREITKSVEKRQRERGATVMGTQVYSY